MTQDEKIKYLTVEQVKALLARAKPSARDHAILLVSYRHGLRASEVGELTRGDVNETTNRLTIRRVKNGLPGEHVLQPDELRAIRRYLRARRDSDPLAPLFLSRKHDPISRFQLHRIIRKYGTPAKLPDDRRHFHVLRHSIAVHLLNRGLGIKELQDWLGHSAIKNTMVYARLLGPRMNAEVARVMRSGGIA